MTFHINALCLEHSFALMQFREISESLQSIILSLYVPLRSLLCVRSVSNHYIKNLRNALQKSCSTPF